MNEIELYLSDSDFVKDTVLQLEKDFQLAGFDLGILNYLNDPLNEILIELEHKLNELILKENRDIRQLLYTLDLSEVKVFELLNESENLKQLSFLILEKAAKKVYLRKQFS